MIPVVLHRAPCEAALPGGGEVSERQLLFPQWSVTSFHAHAYREDGLPTKINSTRSVSA